MTIAIDESITRADGNKTWQALVNIKISGRYRTLRGPPRVNRDDADEDARQLKEGWFEGGMTKIRELQQIQRRNRIR